MKRITFWVMLIAAVTAFATPNANATAVLTLSDGITTQTVTDSDNDGFLLFNGGIGNWIVNVTTGLTKPLIGSTLAPSMDLNSIDVSSTAGGALTITFKDDGWASTDHSFFSQIGGTLLSGGSISARSYIDQGGSPVDLFNETFSTSPFTGSSWTNASISSADDFLVLETVIHHVGSGATSFDFAVSVPEASALLLFGTGLFGLVGYRRVRRMQ